MKGKMKKLLSLALAVMMCAGMIQIPAKTVKAAGPPEFSVRFVSALGGHPVTKAQPGQDIVAILSMSSPAIITQFKVSMLYDETKLKEVPGLGGFTDAFYDYIDSLSSRKFTAIKDCNVDEKANGMVAVYAVAQNGNVTDLPPSMGNIDIARVCLTVADDFEGDIPIKVNLNTYAEDCADKATTVDKEFVAATLPVSKPKVPMTDFTLSTDTLALDLSETVSSQLTISSYTPSNTTDTDKAVSWTTSDDKVAKVAEDGTVTAVGKGSATITATITNEEGTEISKTCEVTVKQSATKVTLDAEAITLKKGQEKQLTATVEPEGADDATISWNSTNTEVATVSDTGLVKAVAENGTAIISAKTANGKTATCTVTVATKHLESITLNKDTTTIGRGDKEKLTITYNPDLNNVTDEVSVPEWKSSDTNVATVDKNGTVTAVAKGTATITATVTAEGKELTDTCKVTVNIPVTGIEVSDKTVEIKKGETKKVSAELTPADAEEYALKWTIDGTSHATIQAEPNAKECVITGASEGEAVVTVTDTKSNKSAEIKVKVTEIPIKAVKVTAEETKLDKGDTTTAKAVIEPADTTDSKEVVWSSDNENVATVDKDGKVKAVGAGTAVIRATSEARAEVSGYVEITVSVPLKSISLGTGDLELVKKQTADLTVTYEPEDTTVDKSKLTWISSKDSVASVDENGKVTAKKAGEAIITAKLDSKVATKKVVVTEIPLTGIALSEAAKTIDLKAGSFKLDIIQNTDDKGDTTDEIVSTKWKSSNEEVAAVSEDGTVTLASSGTAKITATVETDAGKTFDASCDVTVVIPLTGLKIMQDTAEVTDTTIELTKDKTIDLSVQAVPENTTDDISKVTWSSSDPTAVKVDSDGSVTTLKESNKPVTITAEVETAAGKVKASVKISAVEIHITSIRLNKTEMTLEKMTSERLTVTYEPDNTTDAKEIKTWTSSAPEVASVNNGVVTAKKGGTAVITATTANGKSASCTVTVPIHLESISVEPITLKRGDEPKQIEVKFNPENTTDDTTLEYTLRDDSDPGVIELQDNVVTPKKAGTAYVVVTAVNAWGNTKPSAVCTVTVTEQNVTEDDLGFTDSTAGIEDTDEQGVHQVRIDEANPHIELICSDAVTDDVFIEYSVKEGSEDIISVDENGMLTFLKPGMATVLLHVTATDGEGNTTFDEMYEYEMNIYEVPLEGIEFAKDSQNVTVAKGEEKILTIVYKPADTTDKALTWSVSDESVVSIAPGANGTVVVKGLKTGEVTIKAVSESGLEAATTVKVTEEEIGGSGTTNTDKKDPVKKNPPKKAVQTGDSAHPIFYTVIAVLAALGILAVIVLKRRRKSL